MTNKELTMPIKDAIDFIKQMISEPVSEAELYCAELCYGTGKRVFLNPEDYALNTALKALEVTEKYKWHDLRKNPDDLPEFYKKVEVVYWDKETHEIDPNNREFARYGMVNPFDQTREPIKVWYSPYQYFSYDYEIIAWRYIEPIEEVNE